MVSFEDREEEKFQAFVLVSGILRFSSENLQETSVQFLGREDHLEKGKATHSVFWPGESHGLYSPWGHKELDTTERLLLTT